MNKKDRRSQNRVNEAVRGLGARFDPQVLTATQAIFESEVMLDVPSVTVECDMVYGSDPRQRLDVYRAGRAKVPILLFVPGGGFIGGGKDEHPGYFYRNLGVYFARRGFAAVVMNYRLLPGFGWKEQVSDVGLALDWIRQQADKIGGDASNVSAMGASAGASNLASFLFHPQFSETAKKAGIRRAVFISGVYEFYAGLPEQFARYVGGEDKYRDRSPIQHVANNDIPVMLAVAQYDHDRAASQTLDFAKALTSQRGSCPPLYWFGHHNHVSTLYSLGTSDDSVGKPIRAFLRGV